MGESQSGDWVSHSDYIALQQKLDAVLAESEKNLKGANAWEDKAKTIATENLAIRTYLSSGSEEVKISQPETDAILNQVRAEGLAMFAAQRADLSKTYAKNQDSKMAIQNDWFARKAQLFADQLRANKIKVGD